MSENILILNYEYPPLGGGAANATKYLLKEFARHGKFKVDLVTSSTSHFVIEEPSNNIRIHKLDIGKDGDIHYQSMKDLLVYSWKAFWYARKLKKNNDFTVCHAFFGIPCGVIAYFLRIPYIVSLRGSDVPFYSDRFKLLDTLFFKHLSGYIWRRAKHVIANSSGLRKLALKSHSDVEIGVIYNGVDTEKFNASSKNWKRSDRPLKIISVGRLIPRKGFDVIIRSLVDVEDSVLTIIGDGPEKDFLEALALELGVEVVFVGAVSHEKVAEHYRSSDIFAFASKNEGMSNAMMEAMASGLPIVSSRCGGVDELIVGGENGIIVESSDPKKFADAISLVSKKYDHYIPKKEHINAFSWQSVFEKYAKKYTNEG